MNLLSKNKKAKEPQELSEKSVIQTETKLDTKSECCGTCDFIREGSCKRYPPMIGTTSFIQPTVTYIDWCGCYKRAGK